MASEKVESVIAGNYLEMEREGEEDNSNCNNSVRNKLSNFFWHGGSVYDAWFSCSSNQVTIISFPFVKNYSLCQKNRLFVFVYLKKNDFFFLFCQ